jgi:hypothetical protein
MKRSSIRIDGVYDFKTIEIFIQEGVTDFVFDLRPRSLNFLQHYKLIEIISRFKNMPINWYLHFSNEADFIINKFITDVDRVLAGTVGNNVFLEFSDEKDFSWYEQFNKKYFVRMNLNARAIDRLRDNIRNCHGIVLDSSLLIQDIQAGTIEGQMAQLFKNEYFLQNNPQLFILKQWDEEIFEEMYFKVDRYSFPISRRFEISYRNIDPDRLINAIRMVN